MSIVASQLIAKVSVDGASEAKTQLQGVGAASNDAGDKLKFIGGGVAVAGVALIGLGAKAVQMAGDFQSGITSLATGAGESQSNLKMVGDGILDMAVKTGTGTKDLTDGMYMIESAGQHGSAALDTLKAAAEGAKVGSASLADVANGVTTAMTDYSSSGLTASQATNTLIATVAAGKTHMGDLANAMATILPTSAALGVGLTDTSAAMATMTGEGTNAASAATYLHQLLSALENPAAKGAKALKDIGLSSKDVADEMKVSLPGALQMITDHLKNKFPEGSQAYVAALAAISGGSKQMQGMLELTGSHLDTFKGNVSGISDAVKKGGDSIIGWSQVQGDFNFQLSQAGQAVNVLMIKVGTALIPVISGLLSHITPMILGFTDWAEKNHVVEKAISAVQTTITTLSNVLGPVISTIITVVSNIVAWEQKNHAVEKAIGAVQTAVRNVSDVLTPIISTIITVVTNIVTWAEKNHIVEKAIGAVKTAVSDAKGFIDGLVNTVRNIVKWFQDWQTPIEVVAGLITAFFLPALIKIGVESVIAGGKMAAQFIGSLTQTGVQAAVSGAKLSVEFAQSLIKSGVEAVTSGTKIAVSFVQSVVKAGVEAVVSGAKITAQFVGGVIKAGVEGWQAAGKLATLVGGFIATGAQAVLAGAKIAVNYVGGLIAAGAQAVINGVKIAASFVASIISTGIESAVSAGIMLSTLVPALIATAASALATAAPFILVGAIVALIIAGVVMAILHWSDIMNFLGAVVSDIVAGITAVLAALPGFVSGVVAGIAGFFAALPGEIGGIAAGVWNAITGALGTLANWIHDHVWQPMADGLSNAFSGLGDIISGIFNGIGSGIKSAINSVIDMVNGVINSINSVSSHVGITLPTIPHLARGTSNFAGGMALVGEEGPELVYLPAGAQVVPNNQLSQAGGSQPTIIVQTPIYLDGRLLANGLLPHITNGIRYATGAKI